MKTLNEYASRPQGPRLAWVGHRAPLLFSLALPLYLVEDLSSRGLLYEVASWSTQALTLWIVWQGVRHDRRLCEPCAAAMPLDPGAEASTARVRTAFRTVHVFSDPSSSDRWQHYFGKLNRPTVIFALALPLKSFLPNSTIAWQLVRSVPTLVFAGFILYAMRQHNQLQL